MMIVTDGGGCADDSDSWCGGCDDDSQRWWLVNNSPFMN